VRDLIANHGVTEDDPDAAATEPEHSAPRAKNCAAQPHHHARRLWNVGRHTRTGDRPENSLAARQGSAKYEAGSPRQA